MNDIISEPDRVEELIDDENEFVTRVPEILKTQVEDEGLDLRSLVITARASRDLLDSEIDGTALISVGALQQSLNFNAAMAKLGDFILFAIESGLEFQAKNEKEVPKDYGMREAG